MGERGFITDLADGGELSGAGITFLRSIGVDVDTALNRTTARRLCCRPCLDWSERRPHIAGTVGTALLIACIKQGWMRRTDRSRMISVTGAGALALNMNFGIKSTEQ
ncbi:MAG: hypothetical protein ACRYFW_02470 [Janthinobacterium lividum]